MEHSAINPLTKDYFWYIKHPLLEFVFIVLHVITVTSKLMKGNVEN
jgi:hypothetical protein